MALEGEVVELLRIAWIEIKGKEPGRKCKKSDELERGCDKKIIFYSIFSILDPKKG